MILPWQRRRMKEVLLRRFCNSPMGVFGRLIVDSFQCYTIERPWVNNESNVSCIPAGRYRLTLGTHRRGTADPTDDYPAYEVTGVVGRSLIKIHRANTMDDLQGCIAPGEQLGWIPPDPSRGRPGRWAVLDSASAYRKFMQAMGSITTAGLTIIWDVPEGHK